MYLESKNTNPKNTQSAETGPFYGKTVMGKHDFCHVSMNCKKKRLKIGVLLFKLLGLKC